MTTNNKNSMVHRPSNHQTTRDQYNLKLISLSNKNLELEACLHIAQKECRKLEEKSIRQELQIVELGRLVRSLQTDNNALEESAERIVDLTIQVQKLQRLLIEVNQEKLVTPPQGNHHPDKTSSSDGGPDACQQDFPARTADHDVTGKTANGRCNSCNQRNEEIINLEKKLNDYRNKSETLERSVTTLKFKNTEREIRSMTSLRQMRRQIDLLEHDRKRRQDIEASLEERVAILETEKAIHAKEIQGLRGKCNKFEAGIRYASFGGESCGSSDNKNGLLDVQSFSSSGDKPDWVVLSNRIHRGGVRKGTPSSFLPRKPLINGHENDIIRVGSGSDCSDTEASTVSHVGSDDCLHYYEVI
jgi:hypothetical protein